MTADYQTNAKTIRDKVQSIADILSVADASENRYAEQAALAARNELGRLRLRIEQIERTLLQYVQPEEEKKPRRRSKKPGPSENKVKKEAAEPNAAEGEPINA